MDAKHDFMAKQHIWTCFYKHMIFEQINPKPVIVCAASFCMTSYFFTSVWHYTELLMEVFKIIFATMAYAFAPESDRTFGHFTNNQWVESDVRKCIESKSPADENFRDKTRQAQYIY